VRPPRSAADEPAGRFADFLSDPWALLVYLLIFGEGFLCWGAVYYLGSFARRRHGLDQLAIGGLSRPHDIAGLDAPIDQEGEVALDRLQG